MKKCFKCNEMLPLEDFYKHKAMADGHLNKCKKCAKKDIKQNYEKNINHYKEYERKRCHLPHRLKARNEYSKTENYKISHKKSLQKNKSKFPKKYQARSLLQSAIKKGFVTKKDICESCGVYGKMHGHHCDYNKPLDVIWLCVACHSKWHKNNKAIE